MLEGAGGCKGRSDKGAGDSGAQCIPRAKSSPSRSPLGVSFGASQPAVISSRCVFVSYGCRSESPHTCCFRRSSGGPGGWESEIQLWAGLAPSPGSEGAPSRAASWLWSALGVPCGCVTPIPCLLRWFFTPCVFSPCFLPGH